MTNNTTPSTSLHELVEYLKLLSDESRLKILHFLSTRDEVNVRTLCASLNQTQPAVSHHLGLLRMAGLVEMRREGKHNYYRVAIRKLSRVHQLLHGLFPNYVRDDSCTTTRNRLNSET
jgi:ArsR family transcriptional regulator